MARRRDEDTVAVAEPPQRTPAEIVAAAAEETKRLRHEKLVAGLTRWRELCQEIASGHEPGGRELAELAELADVLRLPAAALAESVAAIQQEKQLTEQAVALGQEAKAAAKREPSLQAELVALEKQLRELQGQYHSGRNTLHRLALERNNAENYRREHKLLFGDVATLADRLIERESSGEALSWATAGRLA
jgi:chromosome segregation ATPase